MPREYHFYVYIVASKSRRIYTGVTNNIVRRVAQHKRCEIEGFIQRHKINRLVYFERYQYVGNAILREKQIKALDRAKRVALIVRDNPTWDDLSTEWGKPIALGTCRECKENRSLAALVTTILKILWSDLH
jgi:putative endonuclease